VIFFEQNKYNVLKVFLNRITLLLILFLSFFSLNSFADTTSCYIVIEGKSGCTGLETITDINYVSQLKCFKINTKAKDCGVFVNILPYDTTNGLSTNLKKIDCTGENKNTQECVEYCFDNDEASTSECVDCISLTETEKAEYVYCQDEEDAKWCEAISDDGVGSSWDKVLGGTEGVAGTCLDGYTEASTGAPTRNCSTAGVWDSISSPCHLIACENSQLNENDEIPNLTFPTLTGVTLPDDTETATSCDEHYEITGTVVATCQSDETWEYTNTNGIQVENSCSLMTCDGNDPVYDVDGNLMYSKLNGMILMGTNSKFVNYCRLMTSSSATSVSSFEANYGSYVTCGDTTHSITSTTDLNTRLNLYCEENSWKSTEKSCTVASIPTLENGTITNLNDIPSGQSRIPSYNSRYIGEFDYSCNSGYSKTSTTLKCSTSGSWNSIGCK